MRTPWEPTQPESDDNLSSGACVKTTWMADRPSKHARGSLSSAYETRSLWIQSSRRLKLSRICAARPVESHPEFPRVQQNHRSRNACGRDRGTLLPPPGPVVAWAEHVMGSSSLIWAMRSTLSSSVSLWTNSRSCSTTAVKVPSELAWKSRKNTLELLDGARGHQVSWERTLVVVRSIAFPSLPSKRWDVRRLSAELLVGPQCGSLTTAIAETSWRQS